MAFEYGQFPTYVPVSLRRLRAQRYVEKLKKNGREVTPIFPEGRRRKIAKTFWGQAWCDNLESYAQIANRLERGRTYVRNGSVIHLHVEPGAVAAIVSGTDIYDVSVEIQTMAPKRWSQVVHRCAGKIESVVELLRGELSDGVMAQLCDRENGLFPDPKDMDFDCTCPDARGGWMCKHVAATLYGVGARLDEKPDLLFTLRRVDHLELISKAAKGIVAGQRKAGGKAPALVGDLSDVFGIEIDTTEAKPARKRKSRRRARGEGPKRSLS